jgi:hypothetical protein
MLRGFPTFRKTSKLNLRMATTMCSEKLENITYLWDFFPKVEVKQCLLCSVCVVEIKLYSFSNSAARCKKIASPTVAVYFEGGFQNDTRSEKFSKH